MNIQFYSHMKSPVNFTR